MEILMASASRAAAALAAHTGTTAADNGIAKRGKWANKQTLEDLEVQV